MTMVDEINAVFRCVPVAGKWEASTPRSSVRSPTAYRPSADALTGSRTRQQRAESAPGLKGEDLTARPDLMWAALDKLTDQQRAHAIKRLRAPVKEKLVACLREKQLGEHPRLKKAKRELDTECSRRQRL